MRSTKNTSNIRGWDRRTCDACGRSRVHYRLGLDKTEWLCIGTLDAVKDIVVPHGEPLKDRSTP